MVAVSRMKTEFGDLLVAMVWGGGVAAGYTVASLVAAASLGSVAGWVDMHKLSSVAGPCGRRWCCQRGRLWSAAQHPCGLRGRDICTSRPGTWAALGFSPIYFGLDWRGGTGPHLAIRRDPRGCGRNCKDQM